MSAYLPRPQGRLLVFGVPHRELQAFPWFHVTGQEVQVVVSRNSQAAARLFPLAISLVHGGPAALRKMVTPRLPWERAQEAFRMYSHPAEHPGVLKLTLEL